MEQKFTKDHEWLRLEQGNIALVGISNYAQEQLGDIVFVDIPSVDEQVAAGEVFGYLEAVKTVADLYMPVSGKVLQANAALEQEPQLINQSPYENGWIVRIEMSNPDEISSLMSAEEYKQKFG
jgi:glycine cleavage system H protein